MDQAQPTKMLIVWDKKKNILTDHSCPPGVFVLEMEGECPQISQKNYENNVKFYSEF